jgi:hypothetical protein
MGFIFGVGLRPKLHASVQKGIQAKGSLVVLIILAQDCFPSDSETLEARDSTAFGRKPMHTL